MKKVYRNIVKGYSLGELFAIATHNAKEYNEEWYILGASGMASNAKGRKGYEQYESTKVNPQGKWSAVPAFS
jgi:hypothetical protein